MGASLKMNRMAQVIHITKEAIEQGRLGEGFFLKIGDDGSVLITKQNVREGWDENFKQMHEAGDDKVMFQDNLNDIEDWTW